MRAAPAGPILGRFPASRYPTDHKGMMEKKLARMMLVLGLAVLSPAQDLSVGVMAGIPLTRYFNTGTFAVRGGAVDYSSTTRRYTLGPTVQWHLHPRFSLNVDLLYKRFGYTQSENTSVSGITTTSTFTVTGNSWDIPVLANYRWQSRVSPYIGGGFVVRYMRPGHARGVRTVETATGTVTTPIDTEETLSVLLPGAAIAVGAEIGHGRLRLRPEFRYTRWRNTAISGPLRLNPNQVEFLLGLVFGSP
jgi:hypothetical protein